MGFHHETAWIRFDTQFAIIINNDNGPNHMSWPIYARVTVGRAHRDNPAARLNRDSDSEFRHETRADR